MADRKTVLIIDDHEMARRGLEAMLAAAGWISIIGDAGDCLGGVAAAERLKPDIVLLDIKMPGIDGMACLGRLKALAHPMAVVIITLYDNRSLVLDAIRQGAAGYLLKDATTADVIATLRRVVDGQLAVDPQLLREALDEPVAPTAPRGTVRERAAALAITVREHDVLLQVANGLTNKEIGSRLGISEDTVKKHVQNLIWKLHAADRTQAAILALRMGLLDPDESGGGAPQFP